MDSGRIRKSTLTLSDTTFNVVFAGAVLHEFSIDEVNAILTNESAACRNVNTTGAMHPMRNAMADGAVSQ